MLHTERFDYFKFCVAESITQMCLATTLIAGEVFADTVTQTGFSRGRVITEKPGLIPLASFSCEVEITPRE